MSRRQPGSIRGSLGRTSPVQWLPKSTLLRRHPPGRVFINIVVAMITTAIVVGGGLSPGSAADKPRQAAAAIHSEYFVKAAFLYHFARFTEWPAKAFSDSQAPLRMCVFGSDSFGAGLETIEGKNISGRQVTTSRLTRIEGARRCHVLFISDSERERLPKILEYLGNRPILTIADMPNFTQLGGIINLKTVAGKIRFEINVEAAKLNGLTLSSKLLALAAI